MRSEEIILKKYNKLNSDFKVLAKVKLFPEEI